MTPEHIDALMFNGITPPRPGSQKTTCPQCSPARVKRWEKCLRVVPEPCGVVTVSCYHCGWESAVA